MRAAVCIVEANVDTPLLQVPRVVSLRAPPLPLLLLVRQHLHGRRHLGRAPQGDLLAPDPQARLLALRSHGLLRVR